MHRLAIKRTTKNKAHLSPKTPVTAFVRPRVGTVPFGAFADTCAETAECRLQCTRRGVRSANLPAVRSAITATAELLVVTAKSPACYGYECRKGRVQGRSAGRCMMMLRSTFGSSSAPLTSHQRLRSSTSDSLFPPSDFLLLDVAPFLSLVYV